MLETEMPLSKNSAHDDQNHMMVMQTKIAILPLYM